MAIWLHVSEVLKVLRDLTQGIHNGYMHAIVTEMFRAVWFMLGES